MMGIVAWAIGMTPIQARQLHNEVEAQPDNPGLTEARVIGSRSNDDPQRVTPRLALERVTGGLIDVGIPDDAWSEARVLVLRPAITLVRNRTPPILTT